MDTKKTKEYLGQYKRLDGIIKTKLEQLEELEARATTVTSRLRIDGISSKSGNDRTASLVANITELKQSIEQTMDELINKQRDITRFIDSLANDDYKLLLNLRYINCKTWEQIAADMHYTYKWVHVLHDRALSEVAATLFENVSTNSI